MAKNIFFIDTCILLEILQVPQKFNIKDSETHTELLKERSTDKNSLIIMPISVIVETGNHINQIQDPTRRTDCYNKYIDISNSITNWIVPWQLFGYDYKNQDLARIIDLSKELSISRVGMGDIFILYSFYKYLETLPRGRRYNIEIWTKDKHLESYSRHNY